MIKCDIPNCNRKALRTSIFCGPHERAGKKNAKVILHLTLKKKWFDMIASGEKKEEYRQDKMYWRRRFLIPGVVADMRMFDEVHFTNGYGSHRPFMRVKCMRITADRGKCKTEWGYTSGCYVIHLGEILEKRNMK